MNEPMDAFIDPTPVAARNLQNDEMGMKVGGAILPIIIVACGGTLGSRALITTGVAIITMGT